MTQAAKNNLVNISISRVASVDKGANGRVFAVLKRAAPPASPPPPVDPTPAPPQPQGGPVTKTADKPALDGMSAEQKAYVDRLEKNQKPETPAGPVDLSEVEDYEAEIRKMDVSEATKTFLVKQEKRNRENDALLKSERNLRRTTEHVAVAKRDYPNISKNADALGGLMLRLEDRLEKADYDEVTKLFRASNEQLAKGELFAELGDGGEVESSSATVEIDKRAAELRKADPKLSVAKSRQQAADADPALKKKWAKEQSQGR